MHGRNSVMGNSKGWLELGAYIASKQNNIFAEK